MQTVNRVLLIRTFLYAAVSLPTIASVTASNASAAEPADLAQEARCNICHDAEAQRLGPSWLAIADRYRGHPQALASLRATARAGSSGVWGKPPMPPVTQEQLSDDDLDQVLIWILDR